MTSLPEPHHVDADPCVNTAALGGTAVGIDVGRPDDAIDCELVEALATEAPGGVDVIDSPVTGWSTELILVASHAAVRR